MLVDGQHIPVDTRSKRCLGSVLLSRLYQFYQLYQPEVLFTNSRTPPSLCRLVFVPHFSAYIVSELVYLAAQLPSHSVQAPAYAYHAFVLLCSGDRAVGDEFASKARQILASFDDINSNERALANLIMAQHAGK